MAKKVETVITLTDDLDGGRADRTVSFTYDGTSYEIDLNKKNASALNKALAPYVGAARKVRGARARAGAASNGKAARRGDLGAIREWAKANGHDISDRGRIPTVVTDAYDAAH
jgi:Lsr2